MVEGSWAPSDACIADCTRLAPGIALTFAQLWSGSAQTRLAQVDTCHLDGEALVCAVANSQAESTVQVLRRAMMAASQPADRRWQSEEQHLAALRRAGHAIVAATGKPGDGVVSRYVNRPISQAISRMLLQLPGIAPFHASLGNAILGIAMAICLLFGGSMGLMLGAILFQAASIFDGVDGEVARATFRTSDKGAMLDSLIDALTNLAFISGITINLALTGNMPAASAGFGGLVMLAIGLFLIGRRARQSGQPVNFDVIKVHFRRKPSPIMQGLIWLTMRDFFAAAGALLILAGLTHQALFAFAIVAAGWLLVTLIVLARTARQQRDAWPQTQAKPRYAKPYST